MKPFSTLFDMINTGKPKNIPLLAAEAMGYFTVTVHTTNTAIAHMLGYILSHSSVHAKLKKQLDMLRNEGDKMFSYDDLRKSEYLVGFQCPVQESTSLTLDLADCSDKREPAYETSSARVHPQSSPGVRHYSCWCFNSRWRELLLSHSQSK